MLGVHAVFKDKTLSDIAGALSKAAAIFLSRDCLNSGGHRNRVVLLEQHALVLDSAVVGRFMVLRHLISVLSRGSVGDVEKIGIRWSSLSVLMVVIKSMSASDPLLEMQG